jgi:hypothetical protein
MAKRTVVTKNRGARVIGNYADDVVTKKRVDPLIGNYGGFIRARRRQLHKYLRYKTRYQKHYPKISTSFDIVRAVRINGEPRHVFVLGLGSQHDLEFYQGAVLRFWLCAISSMKRHGLSDSQRSRVASDMVRKGARLPTVEDCDREADYCREHPSYWGCEHLDEIVRLVAAREAE